MLNIFDKQRRRGTQGFGLFDGQELNIVRTTKEDNILKWLVKYNSNLLLFHHRFPTSTPNTKGTAHPFSTKDYFGKNQYIVVHNGHISNSWKLKSDHEELKINYQSIMQDGKFSKFNDSEALLWDLALYLEGKQDKLEFVGAAAFVCIKLADGKLDKLYFGRNSNPLNMLRCKEGIVLSSEGDGEPIDANHLYTWNYDLERLTDKYLSMPTYYASSYSPTYKSPTPNKVDTYSWDKIREEKTEKYKIPYKIPKVPQKRWGERWEVEEDFEDSELDNQQLQEARTMAIRYLIGQRGVFEIAYAELEFDYQQIEEDAEGASDIEALRIYEQALRYLEADEEWINDASVSSIWLALDNPSTRAKLKAKTDARQLRLTEGV